MTSEHRYVIQDSTVLYPSLFFWGWKMGTTRKLSKSIQVFLILLVILYASSSTADHRDTKLFQYNISPNNILSHDLYRQAYLLANTHLSNGNYDDAIQSLKNMQSLVHRHVGVYSPMQFESIDSLIGVYLITNNFKEANRLQLFRFDIAKRNFSSASRDMLQPLLIMANWNRRSKNYRHSLARLELAMEIIRRHQLSTNNLIDALRSQSLTLYLSGSCCADLPLREIVRLESSSGNEVGKTNAITLLTDMLFLMGRSESAIDFLNKTESKTHNTSQPTRHAPVFLGFPKQLDVYDSFLDTLYFPQKVARMEVQFIKSPSPKPLKGSVVVGNPVPLCRQGINNLLGSTSKRLDQYFVDVKMEVTKTGHASGIKLNGNAPLKLRRYIKNVLKKAKYRPGRTDNKFAAKTTLAFHQTFSPTKLDSGSNWGLVHYSHACSLLPRLS